MKLEIQNLKKRLSGRLILDGVDLCCTDGEVIVVLGANGSGKSTFLRLCAGLLEPSNGTVRLAGFDVSGNSDARRHLGYVPDLADPLPELAVAEYLALVSALKQEPPPSPELLQQFAVTPLLTQRIGTLSFGQRKRTCLVAALLGDPWLLILDEPSSGLDATGIEELAALLAKRREKGHATLLCTNEQSFAEQIAGRQYRLSAGRLLASGLPQPLVSQNLLP